MITRDGTGESMVTWWSTNDRSYRPTCSSLRFTGSKGAIEAERFYEARCAEGYAAILSTVIRKTLP